ncbi:sigma-70 family RNA polymerase sigma factor [Pseudoalteromonas sp. Of7M-16]|uniref:sigma-70 family RNA polymerase sigma factor n=1 Tax=Pseudoalteromonas sp. Of7M-16 TaxID=2917756 RepID=UPI001EF73398|nr:sigma-70 family RNA polymerase sigma factor [Pseudoalteromonas sp. Of7M-16]
MSNSAGMDLFIRDNQFWLVRFLQNKLKLHCHHDAQDLSQDTFIRALTSSTDLLEVKEPRAYLATIANRLIIDKARRKRIEQAYIEAQTEMQQEQVPSCETVLETMQRLEALSRLLEGLADKPRRAFLMARLDGMKYKEIAAQLNVSESMVQKYIAQTLLHCHSQLMD